MNKIMSRVRRCFTSLRCQLTMSFMTLTLITALVLGAVLYIAVEETFAAQERAYLEKQAELFVPVVHDVMLHRPGDEAALDQLTLMLSSVSEVRLRVYDASGSLVADSGVPVPLTDQLLPSDDEVVIDVEPQVVAAPPVPAKLVDGTERSEEEVRHSVHSAESGDLIGHIHLSHGPAYQDQLVTSVIQAWSMSAGVTILFSLLIGLLISRRLSNPIIRLTEATERMHEGRLDVRAEIDRDDEVGQLASTFNQMAQRIETMVMGLRRFVADAAHELHTPITALRTSIELAIEAPQKTLLQRALRQVERLQVLTDDLLDLSRLDANAAGIKPVQTNLNRMVQQLGEVYASRAEQKGLNFELVLPDQTVMHEIDLMHFHRALSNLLDNAIKFTPEGGTIWLGLKAHSLGVLIRVQDTGIGVPPGDLPYLFDRFHRGSNTTDYPGSGLGLAIVKAIVKEHHGRVDARLAHPGMQFNIWLPVTM